MVHDMLVTLSDALAGILTLTYRPPRPGDLVLGAATRAPSAPIDDP